MDNGEADRQIKQMIAFIRQEAKEKAEEIRTKTNEDKTIEKLKYKNSETIKLREEFERKRKEKLTEKRIHRSTKINEARFKVMQKRNDLLINLKQEILESLCKVSKNPSYPTFIRYLIVEGLTHIMEEDVEVQCRKEDVEIVDAELKTAKQEFEKLVKREVGLVPKIQLRRREDEYLPPAPSSTSKGVSCRGGVVLFACRRKIKLSNTLESRLEHAFQDNKPVTRALLFGVRPAPANAHRGNH